MKSFLEALKQEWRSAIAWLLSLGIGTLALVQKNVENSIVQLMPSATEWARAALLLLALAIGLAGTMFWQRPKKYRYTWLPDPGCYVQRKHKFAVCQKCLDIHHIESLLSVDASGFQCRNCGQKYAPISTKLAVTLSLDAKAS